MAAFGGLRTTADRSLRSGRQRRNQDDCAEVRFLFIAG
jgi:hypothetical protein